MPPIHAQEITVPPLHAEFFSTFEHETMELSARIKGKPRKASDKDYMRSDRLVSTIDAATQHFNGLVMVPMSVTLTAATNIDGGNGASSRTAPL